MVCTPGPTVTVARSTVLRLCPTGSALSSCVISTRTAGSSGTPSTVKKNVANAGTTVGATGETKASMTRVRAGDEAVPD